MSSSAATITCMLPPRCPLSDDFLNRPRHNRKSQETWVMCPHCCQLSLHFTALDNYNSFVGMSSKYKAFICWDDGEKGTKGTTVTIRGQCLLPGPTCWDTMPKTGSSILFTPGKQQRLNAVTAFSQLLGSLIRFLWCAVRTVQQEVSVVCHRRGNTGTGGFHSSCEPRNELGLTGRVCATLALKLQKLFYDSELHHWSDACWHSTYQDGIPY